MLPLQIKARDGKGAVPSHARQAETHCDSPSWTTQEALQVCNLMTKAAISLLNVLTYLILSALNDNIHTLTHTLSLLFALCVSYCSLPWSVRALGGLNMCSELVLTALSETQFSGPWEARQAAWRQANKSVTFNRFVPRTELEYVALVEHRPNLDAGQPISGSPRF